MARKFRRTRNEFRDWVLGELQRRGHHLPADPNWRDIRAALTQELREPPPARTAPGR